ncbi:patatin-like phospholipase family protein [Pseudooceanicola sp. 216_PA32_1]|uniref:Patatin-like phospholipase family protein n=1 Tax=Pseudooceanicola pacificus TaxID=2676438 RepID=A0A844W109_9RHOB|nr:patatin-like phospholipase family protein [Pseudooceanicola pacificus]MWB77427.1 patatin-like phospholipase family protein [Pseudooceanicola pacificus]
MPRINLALQGGGAHGAFTWGVLDRLIDEEDVEVAAISGTSAGALNGAAFKAGMAAGGREGARAALDTLWSRMGALADMRLPAWMAGSLSLTGQVAKAIEYSWPYSMADAISRMTSPYAYGPFYANPLEPVVAGFDYEKVCGEGGPELFICATNVRDGKIRVFSGAEITTDAILASACLPNLFQAVEIEDPRTGRLEAFWDGGYSGNPALFPLFTRHLPDDVVVVNINPLERNELPRTPQEIQNRINEISFNSSLLRELRAIEFVQRLIAGGNVPEGAMKKVLVHMIFADDLMRELSQATKIVPNPYLLNRLKSAGRAAADVFLAGHKDRIGQESTVDLRQMFG